MSPFESTSRGQAEVQYALALDGRQLCLRCSGEEGLSMPARFSVRLAVPRPDELDLTALVGRPAVLTIRRKQGGLGGGSSRVIVLDVDDVGLGLATRNGATASYLDLELQGPMGRMRYRTDIRVFRDRTVPEIVEEVLAQHRIQVTRSLVRTYRARPYTVQYRETDLDFVQRLLEDEGIFWRALDGVEGETDTETDMSPRVLLGDGVGAWAPLGDDDRVPFAARSGTSRPSESIFRIEERGDLTARTVVLRDFSVDRPSLDLVGEAAIANATAHAEIYQWGGGFDLPEVGQSRAALRAEAISAENQRVLGGGDCTAFAPGLTFRVDGGPPGFEDDHLGLVVVRHDFTSVPASGSASDAGSGLEISFEAIDAERVFRPVPRTPRPIIRGLLEGEVCGPEGADIHTDAMGRVKVRFFWDRRQPRGPDVSDWVPVLQDNTSNSGALPRIGWEVLCAFVDGDPDRPVVMGRLYNGGDPFPTELPAGKTKSALRSLSSPGRDGSNAIWMDDAAGSELMTVHAERDQTINVEHDRSEKVVRNERSVIDGNEAETIGSNRESTTTSNHVGSVEGNLSIAVGGSHSLKVGGGLKETVEKTRDLTIGGAHLRKIGGLDTVTVMGALKETIGGLVLEASLKGNSQTSGLASTLTVGGAIVELTANDKVEQTQMLRVETVLGALKTKVKGLYSVTAKVARVAKMASLSVVSTAGDLTFKSATNLSIDLEGPGKLEAKEITIVVGDSAVSLSSGKIDVVSTTVTFQGTSADFALDATTLNS